MLVSICLSCLGSYYCLPDRSAYPFIIMSGRKIKEPLRMVPLHKIKTTNLRTLSNEFS